MEEPLLPHATALPEEGLDVDTQQKPQRLYPDSFYCPLTQKVMNDPVVGASGISYERSAVLERDAAAATSQEQQQPLYYTNRSLKIMIDKEKQIKTEQGIVQGALLKAEESLRAGLDQVLRITALQTDEYRPLPGVCYCPITLDIMLHPVIDPDGNTYECRAIGSWIRQSRDSPLTRRKMRIKQLRRNSALEDLIALEVNNGANPNDPSIQRWKEARKNIEDEESGLGDLEEEMDESEVDENSSSSRAEQGVEDFNNLRQKLLFFSSATFFIIWATLTFFLMFSDNNQGNNARASQSLSLTVLIELVAALLLLLLSFNHYVSNSWAGVGGWDTSTPLVAAEDEVSEN